MVRSRSNRQHAVCCILRALFRHYRFPHRRVPHAMCCENVGTINSAAALAISLSSFHRTYLQKKILILPQCRIATPFLARDAVTIRHQALNFFSRMPYSYTLPVKSEIQ